jgi:hypothetical protein
VNRIIITALMVIGLFSPPLSAQSLKEGLVVGESSLYKKPFSDAAVVTTLPADSVVRIVQRKGGWYEVKADKKVSGWMRMSALRFGEPASDKQSGNISGLQQTIQLFKTGRSDSSGVTVATGIRGLDAADLQNSQPDHQALERLTTFIANQDGARSFAAEAKLKSQELAYIPSEQSKD